MSTSRAEALKTINRIIGNIKIGMLTTVGADGHMHSRPMDTHEQEYDGDLWFFSEATSRKVDEIRANSKVSVTYASGNSYVSLAGTASLVTDVAKKRALWKDDLKAWFENGPDDPNVLLIRISSESAEYWDGPPGGKIGSAVAAITVMLTGNEDAYGTNERVSLK
ncbi:MAG: pyridoxamine 5'-phosphate oxidase family protein [Pleurocapsa minor GSE-CHR-MK-17-07R]|nr:pyridoxamine 5'-phosphate oxidase family protein [Pleurocapsa minor GSE-CHR-MK 17-07R]